MTDAWNSALKRIVAVQSAGTLATALAALFLGDGYAAPIGILAGGSIPILNSITGAWRVGRALSSKRGAMAQLMMGSVERMAIAVAGLALATVWLELPAVAVLGGFLVSVLCQVAGSIRFKES